MLRPDSRRQAALCRGGHQHHPRVGFQGHGRLGLAEVELPEHPARRGELVERRVRDGCAVVGLRLGVRAPAWLSFLSFFLSVLSVLLCTLLLLSLAVAGRAFSLPDTLRFMSKLIHTPRVRSRCALDATLGQ